MSFLIFPSLRNVNKQEELIEKLNTKKQELVNKLNKEGQKYGELLQKLTKNVKSQSKIECFEKIEQFLKETPYVKIKEYR
ncbi:hypothetical protein [Candidatus Mycoplasma haematobovis]|uniref:hypothetical protein n=1 Tax=Candidatus Mycoplasma haematobovis TaxID=432608 RepID=UPI001650242E|nr:hypothetical protein [Candidatus Mycoplasma haematobovis]